MDLWCYCCLLVINIVFTCVFAEYVIRVDQFNFVPDDQELFTTQSIFLEQDGNRSYLSGHIVFSRPIKEITLLASMEMSYPQFPHVRLFDKKLELCSILNNDNRNKFVRQAYNSYASFLNVQPNCPLKAHFNYTLHRAYVVDRVLPDLLPECTYLLKLDFRQKLKRLAHMNFRGHISPVGGKVLIPKLSKKM